MYQMREAFVSYNEIAERHNKSLDASGGGVFLNLRGAAKGALIRAAASTQPLGRLILVLDNPIESIAARFATVL